jgi:phosphoenolpyruvate synthase/pyruvate phosphate dikinase
MQQSIYHFSTNKLPKITEVGGKADSLIQMTKMGLPVPEGFVLTVNFFSPWLDELKSTQAWQVFLDQPTAKNCELLKEITSNYKFTTEQSNEINAAFSTHSHYNLFSVRSSSPEEDLSGISFAGMYETLLGVIRDQVEESAAKAFTSMLDFRVIEYKMLNHIDLKNSCISVIVQRQISSDISGIGFSVNTQNNCYDETVIEASFGLGETIVSGNVTPDEYIVEKVKDIILSKKINKKQLALHANKNGGVQEMPIKTPMAQALTDAQILQVAGMIGKCETYYKFPVDTEWAIENDELILLQARPITTYLPLFPELMTKPGEPKILYMDHIAIAQGITDPLSVTGLDIFGEIIDVLELNLFPREKGGLMVNIHGRQYINISNTLRGMGLSYTKTILGEYNQTILRALEPIDLKAEYKSHKKTKPMNKARKGVIKGAWIAIPELLKSRTNYLKLQKECTESADEVYKHINEDFKQL